MVAVVTGGLALVLYESQNRRLEPEPPQAVVTTSPVPRQGLTVQDILDGVDLTPVQPLLETSLTRAALMVGKEVMPDIDVDDMESYIKRNAQFMRQRYPDELNGGPDAAIPRMNTFIYLDALKIRYEANPNGVAESCFLPYIIKTREGTCASMPIFYLAIAEQLGLPVSLVDTPDHFFLRWEDAKYRENIECTGGGSEETDEGYIRNLAIPMKAVQSGTYMRSLGHRETVACMLSIRGAYYVRKGEREKGMRDHLWALALHPKEAVSINNLAWGFLREKNLAYADALAKEADRLGVQFDAGKFAQQRLGIETEMMAEVNHRLDHRLGEDMTQQILDEQNRRMQEQRRQMFPPGAMPPGVPSPGDPRSPRVPNPADLARPPRPEDYLPRQPDYMPPQPDPRNPRR